MKAVLVLGGSVLAISTFIGGLISATAMFTSHAEPIRLASADVSELWTTEPAKVDKAAQSLERIPALASTAPQTAEAAKDSGAPEIVKMNIPDRALYNTGPLQAGTTLNPQPELAADHLEWCADRYRSYRPRDNSYTSFSGARRRCESPYSAAAHRGSATAGEGISEAPSGDDAFEEASSGSPMKEQIVATSDGLPTYQTLTSSLASLDTARTEPRTTTPTNLSAAAPDGSVRNERAYSEETPMKNIILAAAVLSASALFAQAQTAPAPTTNGNTPAVATPDTKNPTAPVAGANSFTESQAKSRIESAGYSDVKDLKKDDKGVWQAMATKGGKSLGVSLDYQGNVVSK